MLPLLMPSMWSVLQPLRLQVLLLLLLRVILPEKHELPIAPLVRALRFEEEGQHPATLWTAPSPNL
jgi:hypothetical protein